MKELKRQRDAVSSFFVLAIIIGIGIPVFLTRPAVTGLPGPGGPPANPCAGAAARGVARVADAAAPLNIFIGRDGHGETRQSAPLTVTTGSLCPGEVLEASASDMVRGDGATLAPGQVRAWAQADSTGTRVTLYVAVAPRYGQVSGAGGYSGTVSLADPRAAGGNLVVNVHVMYPWTWVVIAFSALAAFGGFIWAWLVHVLQGKGLNASGYFWRNFILRVAVVLAATVPVVNAQFLANPDWEGTVSQYITLATLTGAAAIALTPTFRVLALPPSLPPRTEGSNAKRGTAVLSAGLAVVANTSVTANSRVFLISQVDGGTPGFLRVSARTPGTSFTITSSSGTDTSTVAYEICEPG
jgi:hypothetical protein